MPRALRPAWNQLCGMGPLLLVMVLVVPMLLGSPIFAVPMQWIDRLLSSLVS